MTGAAATHCSGRDQEAGFTLLEVIVAMAILALVSLTFVGTRTDAMINAKEARNWRLARELADELLSELAAGAREGEPPRGRVKSDRYHGFSYQIIIGEDRIADHESSEAGLRNDAGDRTERLAWERERDDARAARQKGLSLQAYRNQQIKDEWEEEQEGKVPNEDDLEDVLVVVYFPNVRLTRQQNDPECTFQLKARISTLAIQGLTPEEARLIAEAQGKDVPPSIAAPGASPNGQEQQ